MLTFPFFPHSRTPTIPPSNTPAFPLSHILALARFSMLCTNRTLLAARGISAHAARSVSHRGFFACLRNLNIAGGESASRAHCAMRSGADSFRHQGRRRTGATRSNHSKTATIWRKNTLCAGCGPRGRGIFPALSMRSRRPTRLMGRSAYPTKKPCGF
jgi:hypothetical protein